MLKKIEESIEESVKSAAIKEILDSVKKLKIKELNDSNIKDVMDDAKGVDSAFWMDHWKDIKMALTGGTGIRVAW